MGIIRQAKVSLSQPSLFAGPGSDASGVLLVPSPAEQVKLSSGGKVIVFAAEYSLAKRKKLSSGSNDVPVPHRMF